MQISLLLFLLFSAAVYLLANHFLIAKHDPKEPPLLPPKIPLVGHVIGLMRQKVYYYLDLRRRYGFPIYTLAMPGGSKIYVITSIDLIGAVQRVPKILSFAPIEAKFAMIICASSKEANRILNMNINGDEGDWGYSMDFHRSLHPSLAPGPGLDAMNRVMIKNITISLDHLYSSINDVNGPGGKRIGLMKWLRHQTTLATTNSVYGPLNPFKDSKVEEAFWDFGSDLGLLVVNFFPSLSARNGFRGRKIVSEAFFEYFKNNGHESGSTLVQNRYNTSIRNHIPVADIARFEVGGSIAVLVNTAPTTFWMFFHVYSNAEALKDIRDELESIMTSIATSDGTRTRKLEMASIKSKCPILTSTFQEVLRHHSVSVGVRQVMEDTLLNNKYLLRKDSTIFMPNIVTHQDPSIWGADVSHFDHKRFIKGQRAPAAAFRAFGGGSTRCPGRHFATTEILAMVAMALMRYDISPVAGNGWLAPSTGKTNIAAAVNEPDYDIEVEVKARKGFESGQWLFGLENSDMVLAIAAEDKPNPSPSG